MTASSTRSALLLALSGFALLSIGDAIVKSVAGAWPGTAVAALRYGFGALGLSAIVAVRARGSGFMMPRAMLQFGRGAAVALATICFFMGVMAMPLADATAIQFTSPMLTGLLAPLLLGERSPRAVWGATLLAFAGVLVVLRPNVLELGAMALWPLGAALGMAFLMVFNRKAAGLAPVIEMQLYLSLFAAPLLLIAAGLGHISGLPQFHVEGLNWSVSAKCAIVACTATTGHLLIYAATTQANAAIVAPMTYVQLLVAGALGWAWFGDAPDLATWGGAALIIIGGLWLWRSQQPRGTD